MNKYPPMHCQTCGTHLQCMPDGGGLADFDCPKCYPAGFAPFEYARPANEVLAAASRLRRLKQGEVAREVYAGTGITDTDSLSIAIHQDQKKIAKSDLKLKYDVPTLQFLDELCERAKDFGHDGDFPAIVEFVHHLFRKANLTPPKLKANE